MTEEPKWTKSSWRDDGHSIMAGSRCVATAWCNSPLSDNETRANARLIAAAPDMLLALSWLVGLKDERPSDYVEQKPLAWAAARLALNLVREGRS